MSLSFTEIPTPVIVTYLFMGAVLVWLGFVLWRFVFHIWDHRRKMRAFDDYEAKLAIIRTEIHAAKTEKEKAVARTKLAMLMMTLPNIGPDA